MKAVSRPTIATMVELTVDERDGEDDEEVASLLDRGRHERPRPAETHGQGTTRPIPYIPGQDGQSLQQSLTLLERLGEEGPGILASPGV